MKRLLRAKGTLAALHAIGFVATVFTVSVALTLAAAELQARRRPPLDLRWAAPLTASARSGTPEAAASATALAQLDALARQAYFNHMAFRERGLVLLLAGLVLAFLAFGAEQALAHSTPDPRTFGGAPQPLRSRNRHAAALTATAGLATALTLALRWLPVGADDRPSSAPATAHPNATPPANGENANVQATADARSASLPMPPSGSSQRTGEATTATGAPWPSFRGPHGDGIASAQPPGLETLAQAKPRWQTPLTRPGFSSPVVWGSRIFLSAGDATSRDVSAFDLETGSPLWSVAIPFQAPPGTELPKVSDDTGFAAATPAADADAVYAIFATGDVVAIGHDGAVRWQQNLGVPENPYGHASSLLARDGILYVQFDTGSGGRAFALRGTDGTTVWDIERDVQASWASPVWWAQGTGVRLLLNAPDHVTAVDPATGAEAWSVEGVTGEVAPSPAIAEGRLFLAQEYSRLVAFDLATEPPTQLWEAFDELPDISSPVAGYGSVWIATSNGAVSCHDAATGGLRWRHEFDAGFNASPVLAGDHLFLLDLEGNLHIVGTGSAFEELATVTLGEAAYATPAFLEGRLVIRTRSRLLCLP